MIVKILGYCCLHPTVLAHCANSQAAETPTCTALLSSHCLLLMVQLAAAARTTAQQGDGTCHAVSRTLLAMQGSRTLLPCMMDLPVILLLPYLTRHLAATLCLPLCCIAIGSTASSTQQLTSQPANGKHQSKMFEHDWQ
jgi:hypothetical protein